MNERKKGRFCGNTRPKAGFCRKNLTHFIHGYSQREAQRLRDQATSVSEFLHFDSVWAEGSRVLEIGCGVGAQTRIIAKRNPQVQFTSIDISKQSLQLAHKTIAEEQIESVDFSSMEHLAIPSSKVPPSYDHSGKTGPRCGG